MFLKEKLKIICFYVSSLASIFSFILLVIGFTISDFSIKNVFFNSSSILPFAYKIAASWSSHEGSMLLWFSLLCIISYVYIRFFKLPRNSKALAISVLALVQVLFASFILFSASPFDALIFTPDEGLGLNPMLQDVALQIHPPLLYIGNVSYIVLFTNGFLMLRDQKDRKQILDISKLFSSGALMTLTLGIGLGSWWAYRELGWGGFWFFDPVENISLLPWISGIILHHFLVLSIKNDKFLRLTAFFSLFTFLLTIYGTFMVRSGIISSVHSFAFAPERGLYILSICLILTIFSVLWFVMKQKNLKTDCSSANTDQEDTILIGNMLQIVALVSLLISIIYPIYSSFILGQEVVIDPEYFSSVFLPIYFPILILAAIGPSLVPKIYIKLKWIKLLPIILSLVIIALLHRSTEFGIISALMCLAATYLMLNMIMLLLLESGGYLFSLPLKRYSFLLGHFGFGLLAFSITLNSLLAREVEFIGKIGDEVYEKEMKVRLDDIKLASGVNYYKQVTSFSIEDRNNNLITLRPENRLYKIEKTLSQEVDIHSFMFHDLYAVLNKIDGDIIHAKIYYQPWISMIWLSIFIIASGFCTIFFRRGS
ncbi:heme lyase CcmF/NrfE family subunit [Rickettsiaceae bacterium]|nr:heme lyase CcmF/NrfE family subunit [Rickettsiaceae bacterium]